MDLILAGVIFIFMIGLLVFIHELAHFLVAKRAGVIADEFAFGFGPRLFGKRWKGTEYKINLIPLGGYVKMLGDQDASSFARYAAKEYDPKDKEFAISLLKKHKLDPATSGYIEIQEFYAKQEKELSKDDFLKLQNYFTKEYIPLHPGNYDNKRIRTRAAIVIAGVVMNFILGIALFYLLFPFTGYTVDLVKLGNPTFLGAQTSNPPVIFKLYGEDKTFEGSVVVEANGTRVTNEDSFNQLIKDNYGKTIHLNLFTPEGYKDADLVLNGDGVASNFDEDVKDKVILAGVTEDSAAAKAGLGAEDVILTFAGVNVNSTEELLDLLQSHKGEQVGISIIDAQGVKKDLKADLPNPESGPILGASLGTFSGYYTGALRVDYSGNKLFSGAFHAVNMTLYTVTGIGELVGQSIKERNVAPVSQGVTSIFGVADIIYTLVRIKDFANILNLAGLISVTLAFMNILPIPLFDGGNLLFLFIEKLRGRPLSLATQEKIGKYAFFIIVILIIVILIKDVFQFQWIQRFLNLLRGLIPG